jgi:hypothetical protein
MSLTLAGRKIVEIVTWDEEWSCEAAMGERGRAALRLSINEPKKTGARSAAKTH